MKWTPGGRSQDLEDRRGETPAYGGGGFRMGRAAPLGLGGDRDPVRAQSPHRHRPDVDARIRSRDDGARSVRIARATRTGGDDG